MNVRFGDKTDVKEISEVYSQWSEFKGILPDELLSLETREEIEKNLTNINRKYLVVIIDEVIVGVCYIDISFIKLNTIRIGNMMIKKEYRNKGVASQLIDKIKEYAIENNVRKIWLWTQKELTSAIKFYEKKGFQLEGVQKEQFCKKDALVYGLIM
jgi:GNAT superfamily N-acetyltransferase